MKTAQEAIDQVAKSAEQLKSALLRNEVVFTSAADSLRALAITAKKFGKKAAVTPAKGKGKTTGY